MENLTLAYQQQLERLATGLVNPERFGKVAVVATVQSLYPDLPEHLRLFGESEQ